MRNRSGPPISLIARLAVHGPFVAHRHRRLGSLLSIAIVAFFASALRDILAELEGDGLLANAAFGGTLLGLAAGLGALRSSALASP